MERCSREGRFFYQVKTYSDFPGAQGWKLRLREGAVTTKIIQQIWVPPQAHWPQQAISF